MIKMILNSLAKEIMEALDVRKEGSVDVRTININFIIVVGFQTI